MAAVGLVGAGCRGQRTPPPPIDEAPFPECRVPDVVLAPPAHGLFAVSRSAGRIAATAPAARWIDRQTDDGFSLRAGLSTFTMATTLLVLGALAAALLLALRRRRPRPRWGDVLHRRILGELRSLRGLGEGEGGALVPRFEDALGRLQSRARALAERCHILSTRADSTTARAHLLGTEDDLGRLLEQVEQLHLRLMGWARRAEGPEDAAIAAAIEDELRSLDAALKATP
jgi:hypothetical protein